MPSSSPKSPDTPVIVDKNCDLWHGIRNGELVSKDFTESGHLRLSATVHGHPALLRVGTGTNGGSDRFLNKTTHYLPRPPIPPPPVPPLPPQQNHGVLKHFQSLLFQACGQIHLEHHQLYLLSKNTHLHLVLLRHQ